ncbi:MAG TPA: DUF4350 domain-containing protein [Allosphingosinicella sp.]|nr:DUF4350 domain-containing protein [Allosphingosinicella sp.]
MPNPIRPERQRRRPAVRPAAVRASSPSRLWGGAAAFAAAELGAGLLVGRFFEWGRAEALLFFAFRPWLLLAAVLFVAASGWRDRAIFYALALLTAAASESLLVLMAGGWPWAEMLHGVAAGAALALLFDLLVQLGRRAGGRVGQAAAAGLIVAMLVLPGMLRPYEALALGPTAPRPAAEKPKLLLMTGLPLIWGEGGPFDPSSRPAAAYGALRDEFDVRPLDYLDARSLSAGSLLLLAQPRALEPAELAALDRWVREGGRALILTDPELLWPSRLPLGDIRRPPPVSLLSPLLGHWGLRLERAPARSFAVEPVRDGEKVRRLTLAAPGRFHASGGGCRVDWNGYLAACRIGAGRALLLADADLLHDSLWAAPTARGTERHARLADNPLVVGAMLDRLEGRRRERAARAVQWQRPGLDRASVVLAALLPIVAAAGVAAASLRGRR